MLNTADEKERVEIIIRYDEDDDSMAGAGEELEQKYGVRWLVGSRHRGFDSNNTMFMEMIEIQNGRWCWFLNDDAVVDGMGWDSKLATIPDRGYIVHAEFYDLGGGTIHNWKGGNFPIVPKNCWLELGDKELAHPADTYVEYFIGRKHGWRVAFLPGITWKHNHAPDAHCTQ